MIEKRNPRRWVTALCAALCLLGALPAWGQTQYGVKAGDANVKKVNETSITTGGAVGVAKGSLTTITIAPPAENKVAKVTVTKLTGAGTIPATAITISQADNKTEVAVGGTLQLTATPTPSYANSTITWTSSNTNRATVDATGKVTGVAEGSVTITAKSSDNENVSASYTLTVKIPYKDLSMVDNAGNARTSRTTANCYMVHNAGWYKLPLVYGNAIKDGNDNTVAYKPGGTTSNTYCANFVNHAGNAITAPWITKSTSGSGVNKGMGITVNGAGLVWEDVSGLITNVKIDGDYLLFKVNKDAASQEGNAVIAAKSSNIIVWSWHIWVTKQTFTTTTKISTGSHDYYVTPVNLGWVQSGNNEKQGTNTYYQWGRKDPFRGSGEVAYVTGTTATIADNIKNPTTHYYDSSTEGSCNTKYYNMWDAQQKEDIGNITTATKKTVYDPCPAGFCVPTGNLYYFMGGSETRSMTTWDGTNKGATWDNSVESGSITGSAIFFPASGRRHYDSGSLIFDSDGYNWSASPNSDSEVCRLYFYSAFWEWDKNIKRAYGYPVRPVAE